MVITGSQRSVPESIGVFMQQNGTQGNVSCASAACVNATLASPTRAKVIEIAREADKRTNDRPGMAALQEQLRGIATYELDPPVRGAVELLGVLMESFSKGPMRNPKVVEPANDREKIYAHVAAQSTEIFLFGCTAGASVLRSNDDDQRCAVNLGADACLVGVDGGLGIAMPPPSVFFVNAVRTSASNKLVTLQAQGPKTPQQVEKLLLAAARHAQQTGCDRVVFVNASTDKVPSFGDAVGTASSSDMPLSYRELHWIDGEVPQTAEGRAVIVNFVRALGRDILESDGKTMVVFNCHIGLDRSGVTNALTQLIVDHQQMSDMLPAAGRVLKNIKQARPHGISTVFRFELILRCLQDLRPSLLADL